MIFQNRPVFGKKEYKALEEYIKNGGWGTEHVETTFFESEIAWLLDARRCSATTSGTMGLILSLLACGIGSGDEVIVPHITMIATATAVKFVGAKPVLSGVGDNLCSSLEDIAKVVTNKTKAIVYVSLNGRAKDLNKIVEFCEMNDIWLIEDACQSFGSYYHGIPCGTLGDIGVFSLSPHKIISTGQGGLIVTNKEDIYLEIERLKDFGRLSGGDDWHEHLGINAKFTDFQAIIGLAQLETIGDRIKKKRHIFNEYMKYLPKNYFLKSESYDWTPWIVDIYSPLKEEIMVHLRSKYIYTRPMYPPLSKQPCLEFDNIPDDNSSYARKGLMMPSSLDLTDRDIKSICDEIIKVIE